MNFVRNLGERYRLLSGYETVNLIDKTLKEHGDKGLEDWQRSKLINSFGDRGVHGNLGLPFIAYGWEEEKVNGTFGWRLTCPFLIIYTAIMSFIILPLKWVFTGKYYLSQDSRLAKFGVNWYNKITNRRR